MKAFPDCQLYTFVDTAYLHGRDPSQVARELCDGGADVIQLRAKNEPAEVILRVGEALLPITHAAGIPLVINDSIEVALRLGAECVHLGQEDFFEAGFRHRADLPIPAALKVGLSSHAPGQAERAIAAGADYVAVGPVFATPTKPGRPAVTLEYVRWAAANVATPWFAIGGINLQNLDDILTAGAERICVVSAILNSNNISATCREFRRRLPRGC